MSRAMEKKQDEAKKLSKEDLDRQVEESSEESFPASDPPSIGRPERKAPKGRPIDRKPPRIVLPPDDDVDET